MRRNLRTEYAGSNTWHPSFYFLIYPSSFLFLHTDIPMRIYFKEIYGRGLDDSRPGEIDDGVPILQVIEGHFNTARIKLFLFSTGISSIYLRYLLH